MALGLRISLNNSAAITANSSIEVRFNAYAASSLQQPAEQPHR